MADSAKCELEETSIGPVGRVYGGSIAGRLNDSGPFASRLSARAPFDPGSSPRVSVFTLIPAVRPFRNPEWVVELLAA